MPTNPAFESHHPRGEGQRFAEKPQSVPGVDLRVPSTTEALAHQIGDHLWLDEDEWLGPPVGDAGDSGVSLANSARTFKADGEPDQFRDEWNKLEAGGGEPLRVKLTAPDHETKWFRVTADQARQILTMLSADAA